MRKIVSGVLIVVSVVLTILSICTLTRSSDNSSESSESKMREPIGYAIVNGERYDITRYATNHGLPYVETIDGMEICGAGITVFILND